MKRAAVILMATASFAMAGDYGRSDFLERQDRERVEREQQERLDEIESQQRKIQSQLDQQDFDNFLRRQREDSENN